MICAIIVAAGRGTRMGGPVDKIFLPIAGRPLVSYTWEVFDKSPQIDEIVLVIRDEMRSVFEEMQARARFLKPTRFAIGGAERQDSVWNGLEAVPGGTALVAIQDAARPCTGGAIIESTLRAAQAGGAAVAAEKVTDTIKESDGGRTVLRHIDRSRLWSVQTPQCFRLEVIRRAIASAAAQGLKLTDDTAACDLIGQPVTLVENTSPNPKATSPRDLPYLEFLLRAHPAPASSAKAR